MKRFLIIFFIIISIPHAFSQLCSSNRFTEQLVYANADIFVDSNVIYGHAVNWSGVDETLSLNICYPKLNIDTMVKRPMVFLIHGGGFVSGDKNDLNQEAFLFAKRGFISVTIDYRLGRSCASPDTLSYDKAVYRAMQDANAAMRFIVNKADSIRLDTSWIFIGGGSAGAGTCLSLVYSSQQELNSAYPMMPAILGNLDASTNTLTNTFTIKGIFNNWGGVAKDFFEQSEALPTISFHGDADLTVDIDSASGSSCVNPPIVYGSNLIYQKMLQWGVCNQTIVKIGGGHGIYNNSAANIDFRVAKASCFFKSVMCNSCYSDYTTDSIPATCSTTLSLQDEDDNLEYSVYPNPVQTTLFIRSDIQSETDLYIYNITGTVEQIALNKKDISVQNLIPGIYILQVRENGKISSFKFVKE